MIPRGQSRAIKIQGSFNLNSWRTGFSTAHETGLEFAVLDDVPTITARKDSQSGLSHFALLLSPPDNPFPAMRIEASAHICDPLDIRVRPLPPRPDGSRHFLVTFRNNGLHPTSCHARLETGPDIRLSRSTITTPLLEPGRSFSEQIEILSHHDPDDLFHICVQSSLDDGVEVAHKELITFMESRKTGVSPDIDGDLSDWPRESRFIRFGSNLQIIGGYVPWNGPEDCSARLYTCWDDEWIYFGVEFQDDRLSSPCLGFTVYNNDGIELYFDTDHEGDWGEAIYSNDDHQYGLSLEQGRAVVYSWSQLKGESKDSRITLNTSPLTTQTISGRPFRGMIIEAAIPLDELGLAPHEGMQIGFSAAATDDDDPHTVHPFFQEVQFGWTRRKNQWQNPTTFGDLFFTDLGAWPGTPSSTFEALNDERDRLFFSWPTEGLKDISGDLFRKIKRQGFNTISLDWS
ncbi:MAG TPA: sugar-binding protein, partial [Candidatus Sumerlaeota bacterium]|nr:sugar-binding protein [Candidatus Sumerlaeota bacterium]